MSTATVMPRIAARVRSPVWRLMLKVYLCGRPNS